MVYTTCGCYWTGALCKSLSLGHRLYPIPCHGIPQLSFLCGLDFQALQGKCWLAKIKWTTWITWFDVSADGQDNDCYQQGKLLYQMVIIIVLKQLTNETNIKSVSINQSSIIMPMGKKDKKSEGKKSILYKPSWIPCFIKRLYIKSYLLH